MRKFLLVFLLPLLSSGIALSQEGGNIPYFGLKAGGNLTGFHLDGEIPTGNKSEFRLRPMGGLFLNVPASKKLSIQPEILYSVMGGVIKNNGSDINQSLEYISIPVLLKIRTTEKINLLIGPEADLLMQARQKVNGKKENNVDNLRRDDYSAVGGVEYWPAFNWVIGARYIHGFTNLRRNNPFEWYNRNVQVTLGYRFGQKPEPKVIAPPPPPPSAPADTDKDGINDNDDKCPTVPGVAKYNGCPVPDTDKDGVNDDDDKCPSVAGIVKYNGCPVPDADNDGVNDEVDKCPDLAGPADNNGCPKLEASKFNASNVQFVTGSTTLTQVALNELDKAAKILNEQYPQLKVEIAGHTDNTGKPASNQKLSEKRAAAVKTYLEKKGVSAGRLTVVGFGQDQPVADNTTTAGRTKNRRVEFRVSQ